MLHQSHYETAGETPVNDTLKYLEFKCILLFVSFEVKLVSCLVLYSATHLD